MSRRSSDVGGASSGLSVFSLILGLLMMLGAAGFYYLEKKQNASSDGAGSGVEVHLSTPATVAGLTLVTTADTTGIVEGMRSLLTSEAAGSGDIIAAQYNDPKDAKKIVFVAGTTGQFSDPATLISTVFTDDTETIKQDSVHDVATGTAGGSAKCGTGSDPKVPLSVCGWADSGSLGIVFFMNRAATESEPLLGQIRAGVTA